MNAEFTGFWTVKSEITPDEPEIMHFSSQGRALHMVVSQAEPIMRHPMKFWVTAEGIDTYRLRPRPEHTGWLISIRREDNELLIIRSGLEFRCKFLPDSDVPNWFLSALEKTNLKMDSMENSENEIEQAAAENRSKRQA